MDNDELLGFYGQLMNYGAATLNEFDEWYEVPEEIIVKLANMGWEIYTIDFKAPCEAEVEKGRIYCFESVMDNAFKWILRYCGCDCDTANTCEYYKNGACIGCTVKAFGNFVFPISVLASIQVKDYEGKIYTN